MRVLLNQSMFFFVLFWFFFTNLVRGLFYLVIFQMITFCFIEFLIVSLFHFMHFPTNL